jgi:tetratricopeptide (TPR) repeat protein
MGDNAAAVAAYDALLARFADAQEPALREQVARALVNKGVALGRMDDHAAAVAIFDDLLARFADAREPALREQVARALVYKADTLGRMGDNAAAIAILERLILFADDDTPPMLESLYAEARIRLADMLVEFQGGGVRAETLYREAASVMPVLANANLAWSYLSTNQIPSAVNLRESLGDLPPYGLALLDAAIEIAKDNFGSATDALTSALGGNLSSEDMDFSDDLLRLLRLAESRGYGDRLIAWLEASGNADRIAPIYVAFKAYVRRSEAILLDVNPEVRQPAKIIYERLDAPRRCGIDVSPKKKRARRKRG